ncbi:Uncharacterized protein dnl_27760 [Desulfonema limicola]|uniref:Uncharacterized protein n=1 Tax=Desulfonema limicola TaxID=45656 RepID=A0A975GGM3_9BACT|nr:Uncharacterized protein dnl_27760 [Desulfonema limicola]
MHNLLPFESGYSGFYKDGQDVKDYLGYPLIILTILIQKQ